MTKKVKKREYSFDVLRVIAMTMVIVIHVANVYGRRFALISHSSYLVSLVFNTVSRVSVPIFLMISGALLLDRAFDKKKYFQRIKKFIILIAICDIVYLVWEYFIFGNTYDKLYILLYKPYRAHLWYLYTVVILYAVQPLLRWILNKSNKQVKVLLLCLWIFIAFGGMYNKILASYFTQFVYIGYFVVGKYLYDYIKSHDLRKYNKPLILTMIVFFAASISLNYTKSIRFDRFYKLYFAYRTPFIMIPSLAFFTLIISNYRKDSVSKPIMLLSDLSLGVYLFHGIFLDITRRFFSYPDIHSIFGIPVFSVDIFICSVLLVYFLKKVPYIKTLI